MEADHPSTFHELNDSPAPSSPIQPRQPLSNLKNRYNIMSTEAPITTDPITPNKKTAGSGMKFSTHTNTLNKSPFPEATKVYSVSKQKPSYASTTTTTNTASTTDKSTKKPYPLINKHTNDRIKSNNTSNSNNSSNTMKPHSIKASKQHYKSSNILTKIITECEKENLPMTAKSHKANGGINRKESGTSNRNPLRNLTNANTNSNVQSSSGFGSVSLDMDMDYYDSDQPPIAMDSELQRELEDGINLSLPYASPSSDSDTVSISNKPKSNGRGRGTANSRESTRATKGIPFSRVATAPATRRGFRRTNKDFTSSTTGTNNSTISTTSTTTSGSVINPT